MQPEPGDVFRLAHSGSPVLLLARLVFYTPHEGATEQWTYMRLRCDTRSDMFGTLPFGGPYGYRGTGWTIESRPHAA